MNLPHDCIARTAEPESGFPSRPNGDDQRFVLTVWLRPISRPSRSGTIGSS